MAWQGWQVSDQRSAYIHGHHDSVLRSHRRRTIHNSAAYLIPRLRPGQQVLDVGCGPGTTVELARMVAPGNVVGIDNEPVPLEPARADAQRQGVSNVSFTMGDVYQLNYPERTFDVVHAHQVLQHLTEPVAALREMRRVCKPDGYVAARDADFSVMAWYPPEDRLVRWRPVPARCVQQPNRAGRWSAPAVLGARSRI